MNRPGDHAATPSPAAGERPSAGAAAPAGNAAPAPVVVVGLGPVGATVALLLARHGVPVLAVERDADVYPHARAVALDDEALRVLQAAGVTVDSGLALRDGGTVRLRGADGRPLVELPPPPTATGHPGLAFFRQPDLEHLLRARLGREPLVRVRLGCTVTGVKQDADGVTVRLAADGGDASGVTVRLAAGGGDASESVRAAYVLACDGGRSGLRRALGVRLVGRTSGRRWLVVDTDAPRRPASGLDVDAFEFSCDPRRPWVHGPLPGGAHRWELLLGRDEDQAAVERPERVRRLLEERLGGPAPAVQRAVVYAFHARVAARWRVGRVLLLGDAAHLAPPFAGQGLGAGLRDAHNLAWKLAAVVAGEAADGLLDSYARERLPHVLRMTALAAGLGALVQVRRGRTARARDGALRRLARLPRVRAWIARGGWKPPSTVGGPLTAGGSRGRGARGLGRRAGEPLPQPLVRTPDGTLRPLDDALPRGWVLLRTVAAAEAAEDAAEAAEAAEATEPTGAAETAGATGAAGAAETAEAAEATGPAHGPVPVLVGAGPDGLDDGGTLRSWLGGDRVALVRPDRVVFGTAPPHRAAALLRARAAALGAGDPPGVPARTQSAAGAAAGRDHAPAAAVRRT